MDKIKCPDCGADNLSNSKYCSRCGHTLPAIKTETPAANILPPFDNAKNKRKNLLGAIFGIVAFAVSYFAVQQIFFSPPSFDKAMMAAASELNKSCPVMVDQDTRLDNAVALPNNSFQYNYTLINLDKAQVNPDTVKKYVEPGIINNVRTNPDLQIYRDNKTTMIYSYNDRNGVFILKISVTPEMYQ